MTTVAELNALRADLEASGYRAIDHAPHDHGITIGARVCNAGQVYDEARRFGTAEVVAVLRRGTDDRPDSWERSYGRPNVEVIVKRDDGSFGTWQDYRTVLAHDYIAEMDAALEAAGSAS